MSGLNRFSFLGQAASSLRNIRTRTWLMLAAAGLVILGLIAWAGIAILSWLWGQAATVTEAGKRLSGVAGTQIEQVAPGLKAQIEQVAPGLKGQIEQVAPGLNDQIGLWLPVLAKEGRVSDVSGVDVGPVSRYPDMARSHFARAADAVEVRYTGRAPFDAVLAHYVQGFAAADYAQEVISATAEGEQHRFRRSEESIDLSLLRRPNGLLELRLKLKTGK